MPCSFEGEFGSGLLVCNAGCAVVQNHLHLFGLAMLFLIWIIIDFDDDYDELESSLHWYLFGDAQGCPCQTKLI